MLFVFLSIACKPDMILVSMYLFMLNKLCLSCLSLRIIYNIVLYKIHVPIIVQWQSDGCSLSNSYPRVFLTAGGKSSRHSGNRGWWLPPPPPPPLIYFSVDFIILYLNNPIFTLNLVEILFLSCDHTLAHSSNEVVSLRIVPMCSKQEVCCPQGAHQLRIDVCRKYGFIYLETDEFGRIVG